MAKKECSFILVWSFILSFVLILTEINIVYINIKVSFYLHDKFLWHNGVILTSAFYLKDD